MLTLPTAFSYTACIHSAGLSYSMQYHCTSLHLYYSTLISQTMVMLFKWVSNSSIVLEFSATATQWHWNGFKRTVNQRIIIEVQRSFRQTNKIQRQKILHAQGSSSIANCIQSSTRDGRTVIFSIMASISTYRCR